MNTLINIQHTKKKFKFWKNGDLYLNLSARHTRPSDDSLLIQFIFLPGD